MQNGAVFLVLLYKGFFFARLNLNLVDAEANYVH